MTFDEKYTTLYNYLHHRCLWLFLSRNWDREASINNIFDYMAKLYAGKEVDRSTNITNGYYCQAKEALRDIKEDKYPEIFVDLSVEEFNTICELLIKDFTRLAITDSLNTERTSPLY